MGSPFSFVDIVPATCQIWAPSFGGPMSEDAATGQGHRGDQGTVLVVNGPSYQWPNGRCEPAAQVPFSMRLRERCRSNLRGGWTHLSPRPHSPRGAAVTDSRGVVEAEVPGAYCAGRSGLPAAAPDLAQAIERRRTELRCRCRVRVPHGFHVPIMRSPHPIAGCGAVRCPTQGMYQPHLA